VSKGSTLTIQDLTSSVCSLEGGNCLHGIIQSIVNDISESNFGLVGWVVQEGQSVLHPLVIESLGEVIPSVGSSRLLSVLSGEHGHLSLDHQILEFHSLDQVSVPDLTTVRNTDVSDALRIFVQSSASLFKVILTAEDGSVFLHGLLHLCSNLSS